MARIVVNNTPTTVVLASGRLKLNPHARKAFVKEIVEHPDVVRFAKMGKLTILSAEAAAQDDLRKSKVKDTSVSEVPSNKPVPPKKEAPEKEASPPAPPVKAVSETVEAPEEVSETMDRAPDITTTESETDGEKTETKTKRKKRGRRSE